MVRGLRGRLGKCCLSKSFSAFSWGKNHTKTVLLSDVKEWKIEDLEEHVYVADFRDELCLNGCGCAFSLPSR